jgi:hypothetical protein
VLDSKEPHFGFHLDRLAPFGCRFFVAFERRMFASGGGIRSAGGAGEGGKWRWQSAVGRGSVGRRWNIKIVETK